MQVHYLTVSFTAVFDHCCEIGMELPFMAVCMDRRGSVIAIRVHGGGRDADVLTSHFVEEIRWN